MIEMVSMKTFSAREPDHSASTKPIEMRSKRPPLEARRCNVGVIDLVDAAPR